MHYKGDFNEIKPADLLICKDVLQHLPIAKIKEFISILPKFKYALITNDINLIESSDTNTEILPTEYRFIDLRLTPFNLPLKVVYEFNLKEFMPDNIKKVTMVYENKI